ncbi:hypothetical protein BGZ73_007717 [Actinomortierella ambigua]|nr:hypothetical protein BGZ73_007717 [Actinomortierella ambigua]
MAASFDALKRRRASTASLSDASQYGDHHTKKQRMLPPSPAPELNPFNAPTVLAIERMFDRVAKLAKKPSLSSKACSAPFSSSLPGHFTSTTHAISKPQSKDTIPAFQPKEATHRQQTFSREPIRAHTKTMTEDRNNTSSSGPHKYRYMHPPFLDVGTVDAPPQPSKQATTAVSPPRSDVGAIPSTQPVSDHPRLRPLPTLSQPLVSPSASVPSRAVEPPSSAPVGAVELIDSDDSDEEVGHEEQEHDEVYDEEGEGQEEEELWIEDGSDHEDRDDEHEQEEDVVYQGLESEEDEEEEEDDEEDYEQRPQPSAESQVVELLSSDDEQIEEDEEEEEEAEEDEPRSDEEEDQVEEAPRSEAAFRGSIRLASDGFNDSDRGSSIQDDAEDEEEEVGDADEGDFYHEEEDLADEVQAVEDVGEQDESVASDVSYDDGSGEQYAGVSVGSMAVPPRGFDTGEAVAEATPSVVAEEIKEDTHDGMSSTRHDEDYPEDLDGQDSYLEGGDQEPWPLQQDNAGTQEEDVYTLDENEEEVQSEDVEAEGDIEDMDADSSYAVADTTLYSPPLAATTSNASVLSGHESGGEDEEEQEEEQEEEHQPIPIVQRARPTMWQRPAPREPEVAIVLGDSDEEEEAVGDGTVDSEEHMEALAAADDIDKQDEAEQFEDEQPEGGAEYLDQDASDRDDQYQLEDETGATILGIEHIQSDFEEPAGDVIATPVAIFDEAKVFLEPESEPETNSMPTAQLSDDGTYFEQLEAAYVQVQEEELERELADRSAVAMGKSALPQDTVEESSFLSTAATAFTVASSGSRQESSPYVPPVSSEMAGEGVQEGEKEAAPERSPFKTRLVRTGTMVQTIRDGNLFLQQMDARAAKGRSSTSAAPVAGLQGLVSVSANGVTEPSSMAIVAHEYSNEMARPWQPVPQQSEEQQDIDMESIQQEEEMYEGNALLKAASTTQDADDVFARTGSPLPPISAAPTTATIGTGTTTLATTATAKPMLKREMMQLVKEAREFCQSSPSNPHLGELSGEGTTSSMVIRRTMSARTFSRRRGSAHSDQQDAASLAEGSEEGSTVAGVVENPLGEHATTETAEPSSSIATPSSVSSSSTATAAATTSSSGVVDLAAERVIESALVGSHALRAFIHPPVSPIRSPTARFSPSSSASSAGGGSRMPGHGSRSGSVERAMSLSGSPLGSGHVISGTVSGSSTTAGAYGLPPPPPFPTIRTAMAANQAAVAASLPPTFSTVQPVSPFQFGAGVAAATPVPDVTTDGSLGVGFTFGANSTSSAAADEHSIN